MRNLQIVIQFKSRGLFGEWFKIKIGKFNKTYILNLSFDQEIQKLVISESLEKETSLIARSKSENQIESVDGIPTYEQYHALRKPVQSLVPFPTPTTSFFRNLSMNQDSILP